MDRSRFVFALTIGVLFGLLAGYGPGMDVLWPLYGARRLLAGVNPYAAPYSELSTTTAFTWLYYPLPALLLCMPFVWLPDAPAVAVTMGIAGGLAAWSLFSRPGARWALASYPALLCILTAQPWPLLACAALYMPALAPLMPAKPSGGLAILFARPAWHWLPVGISMALLAASIPLGWLNHLGAHDNMAAITLPWSAAVALLIPRLRHSWRARYVLLVACLPLRIYDLTPLGTLSDRDRDGLLVVIATWLIPLAAGSLAVPYEVLAPGMLAIATIATIAALRTNSTSSVRRTR